MFDLNAVQQSLEEFQLDGWLLYDFRHTNVLANRVLDIAPDAHASRRWAYAIPKNGQPKKLVHKIEPFALDHLPGEKTIYLSWQEFEAGIAHLLGGINTVAMEYSARNGNPYISRVDAGTIEIVRDCGVDIQPSGDLIQRFEATWSEEEWQMHLEVEKLTTAAFAVAWDFLREQTRDGGETREYIVQQQIMDHFARHDLLTDHAPVVAVGPHSADPHYCPQEGTDSPIREGDFVLIDLWAKLNRPRSVYSDLTRTAFVGAEVPQKYTDIFNIVAAARDAAIARVEAGMASSEPLFGWQVDDACRQVIEDAGYGEYYVHRTGHSIGQETHGNGANIDNLETREDRRVLPSTCFSVEPGIYLPDFGIRSEVNVFVGPDRSVNVTGGPRQTEVVAIHR